MPLDDASQIEALKSSFEQQLQLPAKYVPQKPTAHQALFLLVPHYEVFFGGSAGPGKSSALLMAALQYVEHPDYHALILRQTFRDLNQADALIPRSKEWLYNTDATYNQSEHQWRFPSGATLTFGHMENENDKYKYQGAAWQFVGFDELTQFTHPKYDYLHSRIRKAEGSEIPLRIRGTGNPGGIGHEWVKDRFVTPKPLEDLPYAEREQEAEDRKDRLFIPALLDDNPHIDKSYRQGLMKMDAVTRAQLLNGDWEVVPGGNMFKREWFDGRIHLGRPNNIEMIRQVRYWDLASSDEPKVREKKGDADYTASCLLGLGDNGQVYILDMTRDRLTPAEVEKLVRRKAEMDGRSTYVFIEQEPGSSGVNTISYYARYVLLGFPFWGDKPTANKTERARPASSAVENGNVHIIRGSWTDSFLMEASGFPVMAHDDMVDAFTGAFAKIALGAMIGRDYKEAMERKRKMTKRKLWG